MKIELKNIKVSLSLSDETYAFTASLYVDGKKIGMLSNRGCGGDDEFTPSMDQGWAIKSDVENYLQQNGQDFECVVSAMVHEHVVKLDINKTLAKYLLFKKPNDSTVYQYTWPKGALKKVEFLAAFKEAHPNHIVVNSLCMDEIKKIFKSL